MTAKTERRLEIIYRDPFGLTADPRNARTHSPEQIEQLRASIREFGFTNPVLLRPDGMIGAGHGRVEAAKAEKLNLVPTCVVEGLTDDQWRAYVLADNKLALNAGWDEDLLREELAALQNLDLDLSSLGFDDSELADLFKTTEGATGPDETPEPPAEPTTRLGDVWLLGDHRVMCGDSLSLDAVTALCAGTIPDLANCDPPYGISVVKGSTIGGAEPFGKGAPKLGRVHGPARNAIIKPGTYSPIIGDDTTDTAVAAYGLLVALGVKVIALWGGNYFANHLPPSRCWLVWDKENTGTFADAELAWTNQDAVVRVLRHQWSGLIKASERGERRVHPTQKPVALAEWVAQTIAPKAKSVIDLFLGSASTLIAAEKGGLRCFGMELSPAYVDVAVRRWEDFTGRVATLEATGQTFREVAEERAAKEAA